MEDINLKILNCNFLYSVMNEDTEEMKSLIEKGANINFQDDDGNTPLHIAIENDLYISMKILIEKGADKNIKNNDGYDSYDTAIFFGKSMDEIGCLF